MKWAGMRRLMAAAALSVSARLLCVSNFYTSAVKFDKLSAAGSLQYMSESQLTLQMPHSILVTLCTSLHSCTHCSCHLSVV
eukprot:UN4713